MLVLYLLARKIHHERKAEKMTDRLYVDLIVTDTAEADEFSAIVAITRAGSIALGRMSGETLQGVSSRRVAPSRALDYVRSLDVSYRDEREEK